MSKQTVYILCDNGAVMEHDLPLPSGIQARVDAKQLHIVDPPEKSEPEAPADPEAVPTGKIPAIMAWVGDDKERAQKALDAENATDKPRSTLVAELTELLNA